MNKIIIVSENKDQSTSKIIRWINHYGHEVTRINIHDPEFQVSCLTGSKAKIQSSQGLQEVHSGDTVWFRRFSSSSSFFMKRSSSHFEDQLTMFEFHEQSQVFMSFIHFVRFNCNVICDPQYLSVNKVHVLLEAQNLGIECPPWLITDRKKEVSTFFATHGDIVHKTFNQFSYAQEDRFNKVFAQLMKKHDVDEMPETFKSAFFQKYIEKKYELRIFFFKERFFSMAIFSQNDDTMKVDFRNYNRNQPNRNIPVNISRDYKNKLCKLADKLNLDSGSFDVLVTNNDEYYFLEVNPVGQFGMVSFPCNYYIEQSIAKELITHIQKLVST